MNGSAYDRSRYAAENLRVVNQTYGEAIAEGDIANHVKWRTNGINVAVGTTELVLMTGATARYPWPAVAIPWYFSSSSANDTAGGTGARTLLFTGIDGSWNVASETVALNGVGRVAPAGTYLAPVTVETKCATWGTGLKNAGVISAYDAAAAGNVLLAMDAGTNAANVAVYMVPAGKTMYLKKVLVSCVDLNANQFTTIRLYEAMPGSLAFFRREPYILANTPLLDEFWSPPKYAAGTRIEITGVASGGTAGVAAKALGWIE